MRLLNICVERRAKLLKAYGVCSILAYIVVATAFGKIWAEVRAGLNFDQPKLSRGVLCLRSFLVGRHMKLSKGS